MLPGLYSAATALHVAEQNQELVARNLAHVNVGGFRRSFVVVESLDDTTSADAPPTESGLGAHVAVTHTDFSDGMLEVTDRSLDVAIMGDGFFVVDGPDGPLYTRNGSFFAGEGGQLVDVNGRVVQGEGGPIAIPAQVSTKDIQITEDGSIRAGQANLGQLRVVQFSDNAQLISAGTYSFTAPPDLAAEPSDARIIQGSRELSNVNPVEELVRMTVGLRYYEAAQRVLHAMSESIAQNTDPQAG